MKTHRTYHFLTALLSCILLLMLGCLPIAAAEDLLLQNQAVADETAARFSALITHYEQKEAQSKTPANRTIRAIGTYSAEAATLITSNMDAARAEDLRPAFSLLYEKGALVAKLSWIAYAHDVIDEGNEQDAVYVQYKALCDDVQATSDEATLAAYADSLCIRMNRTVFKQKIQDLPRTLGVDEAHILDQLVAASAEIDNIESADVDGAPYLVVYERTRNAIVLEQNRLSAKAEFSAVYTLLDLPSADKLSDLYALSDALTNATSTAEINRALLSAVRTALERALPGNGLYTTAYRQSLASTMEAAVQEAADRAVVSLSPYLDGSHTDFPQKSFRERAQIVFAKDRIEALRTPNDDAALCNLLNAYVENGGILDLCQTKTDLDFEVMRATYRTALARKKAEYLSRIEQILPTASVGDILLQLKSIHSEVDDAMCACPRTDTKGTFEELLAEAVSRMDDLVFETEAERFRITHADVLRDTTITEDDRLRIGEAIDALNLLNIQTKAKLQQEAALLNRQYKTLTLQVILGYAQDDSCPDLRAEIMETLAGEVESLNADTVFPTVLRAEADAWQARAEAIHTLLCRYHVIRTHPHYASYDSDSVVALSETVRQAIERLCDPTKTDANEPPQGSGLISIATLQKEALCNLERYFAVGELRLAANGSTSLRVQEILTSASAEILQCNDHAQIQVLCENAVFRIGACRKADEMRREWNALGEQIRALRGLSDAQKEEILQSEAFVALQEACTAAENAENSQALAAIAATFADARQTILQNAEAQALAAGIDAARREVAGMLSAFENDLAEYQYIREPDRVTHSQRLEALRASWEASLALPIVSWDALDQMVTQITESLMGLRARAEADENEACRDSIVTVWHTRYALPSHYSQAHYQTICALLTEGTNTLGTLATVRDLLAYADALAQRLEAIPTHLDEAKSKACEQLNAVYLNVLKNKTCYATTSWAKIEEIYRHSLEEIELFSDITNREIVTNIATVAIESIQNVCMDHLYSSNEPPLSGSTWPESYPQDYDPFTSGYWGKLSAQGAIPFNAHFSVLPFSADHITESLRASIRQGDVLDGFGNPISGKRLRLLRNCSVISGLSLSYSHASVTDGTYRITLLLPENLDTSQILGVVYFRDDNYVEFYDCSMQEKTISFDIHHFSDFYIVTKKTTDLTPIIIVLALILLCEVAAILYLLFRRKKDESTTSNLAAVIPTSAIAGGVVPKGGVAIVVVLSLCVLAATGVLAWLIIDEKARRRSAKGNAPLLASKNTTAEAIPSPLAVGALAASSSEAPSACQALTTIDDSDRSVVMSTSPQAPRMPEALDAVTAELANEIMSDEEAKEATKQRNTSVEGIPPTRIGKKFAVNIDVISNHFSAYDTVTLEALKKRGLLPKRANAVKILARGTLDKPLTVIADDFSATAIKMILLTGGEAVLARSSTVEKYN